MLIAKLSLHTTKASQACMSSGNEETDIGQAMQGIIASVPCMGHPCYTFAISYAGLPVTVI